ncbi:MAG TPA: hypothetical protein VGM66_10530 [Candidatus Udaeobacter sp.]|jgi:hypothetical protein
MPVFEPPVPEPLMLEPEVVLGFILSFDIVPDDLEESGWAFVPPAVPLEVCAKAKLAVVATIADAKKMVRIFI